MQNDILDDYINEIGCSYNSLSENCYHLTGGKAGGPLRGPGSVIMLYNNTFEMDSDLHWL